MNNPFDIPINSKAREITSDAYSNTQAQINSALVDLHTAMPAIIMSYDAKTRTVKAQPTIQRIFTDGDGIKGAVNLPPCVDVPVVFPSGGGFELTFPIAEGDECLLIFSERCIDSWFESGEPSPPADYRRHDLSDGFAIVGIQSKPRQVEASVLGVSLGNTENRITIEPESVTVKKGEAVLTLTDEKLTSSVDIYCPNVITDSADLNSLAMAAQNKAN